MRTAKAVRERLGEIQHGAISRNQRYAPPDPQDTVLGMVFPRVIVDGGLFSKHRYKTLFGGRGSAKSWSIARATIMWGYANYERFLCTREYQNSIQESVHKLIVDQIDALCLSPWFTVTKTGIYCNRTGAEWIFAGLKNDPRKVKSTEGVTKCWVEEAEKVSKESWEILIPTIRAPGSEIIISFNPDLESDETWRRFVANNPPRSTLIACNWRDNPWFPEVLREEKDYLYSVDPDAYDNIWEGKPKKHSAARILNGKYVIKDFNPVKSVWQGPFYGADFGFTDPSTLVKCWRHDNCLWIEEEWWGVRKDTPDLVQGYREVTGAMEHLIRGDSAKPETISQLRKLGVPIVGARKWPGSVADGISHLRGYREIVIHSRCVHTAEEAKLWSRKVDRNSGEVLEDVEDKHNHCWDGVMYALRPFIRPSWFDGCETR